MKSQDSQLPSRVSPDEKTNKSSLDRKQKESQGSQRELTDKENRKMELEDQSENFGDNEANY